MWHTIPFSYGNTSKSLFIIFDNAHACFVFSQTAIAIPEESGYTVYSSTQWIQQVQSAVAGVLGIPNNK